MLNEPLDNHLQLMRLLLQGLFGEVSPEAEVPWLVGANSASITLCEVVITWLPLDKKCVTNFLRKTPEWCARRLEFLCIFAARCRLTRRFNIRYELRQGSHHWSVFNWFLVIVVIWEHPVYLKPLRNFEEYNSVHKRNVAIMNEGAKMFTVTALE